MAVAFAIVYLPVAKLRTVVIIDVVMAAVVAAIPLLHQVGPQAAPTAFLLVAYPGSFIVCFLLGTDSGIQMQYMAYAACAVLVLGLEPLYLPIVFGVLALTLTIALEVFAPRDGGLLSKGAMLASFIGCATGTGTIMFAVVFYAVRTATRAELTAESEYQRSEGLLLNILPARWPIGSKIQSLRSLPTSTRMHLFFLPIWLGLLLQLAPLPRLIL
jgi:adenylate cyclase